MCDVVVGEIVAAVEERAELLIGQAEEGGVRIKFKNTGAIYLNVKE